MKAFDTNPGETLSGQIRLPEGVETVRRQITLGRERVCVSACVWRGIAMNLSIK